MYSVYGMRGKVEIEKKNRRRRKEIIRVQFVTYE